MSCSIFRLVSKKCKLVCFGVEIMIFLFFGVKKSGISVFLVSVENSAGVNKMTNISYGWVFGGNKMVDFPLFFQSLSLSSMYHCFYHQYYLRSASHPLRMIIIGIRLILIPIIIILIDDNILFYIVLTPITTRY